MKLLQKLFHQKIDGDLVGIDTLVVGVMRKMELVLFTLSDDEVTFAGCTSAISVQTTILHFVNIDDIAGGLVNAPVEVGTVKIFDVEVATHRNHLPVSECRLLRKFYNRL